MKRTTSIFLMAAVALAAVAAAVFGYWQFAGNSSDSGSATTERKVLYWTDPMVPGYRSDKPGKSPFMDMELVPVYAEDGGAAEGGVSIRPEVINNLGVRTAQADKRAVERHLKVPGYVLRTESGGLSVVADVFDRDADWVRPGIAAMIQADAVPGKQWQGKVTRVEADIDVGARSWRVTLHVTASDGQLRPNMSTDVTLHGRSIGAPVLAVPRDSVIRTGERSVVVRALDGGRFEPAVVDTGREFGDWIEIKRGIADGDRVVVSGQFLIDSEANLRAAFERLAAPPAAGSMDAPADSKPPTPATHEHNH